MKLVDEGRMSVDEQVDCGQNGLLCFHASTTERFFSIFVAQCELFWYVRSRKLHKVIGTESGCDEENLARAVKSLTVSTCHLTGPAVFWVLSERQ